ncbi:hypothetical protein LSAT2_025616 [Lamellibrachia satsuma]|nr:hypothetical protein LSAT2_025616 [Lamellibrachia satsuma]
MTWFAKDLKMWCSQHKLQVSDNEGLLAKRVYRAMHYADSNSDVGDSDDDLEEPASTVTLPTTRIPVTTDDIPPIRDSDESIFDDLMNSADQGISIASLLGTMTPKPFRKFSLAIPQSQIW